MTEQLDFLRELETALRRALETGSPGDLGAALDLIQGNRTLLPHSGERRVVNQTLQITCLPNLSSPGATYRWLVTAHRAARRLRKRFAREERL